MTLSDKGASIRVRFFIVVANEVGGLYFTDFTNSRI